MRQRWIALILSGVMTLALAGCSTGPEAPSQRGGYYGGASRETPPPPTRERRQEGLSTKQKVALLAGAAALAYLYNKHKNKQGHGPEGQYYRSKNGRIYYRDAEGRAHWVTPPSGGIRVPADEAERYRRMADDFRYEPAASGRGGYGSDGY
jgi:hypothetical protein